MASAAGAAAASVSALARRLGCVAISSRPSSSILSSAPAIGSRTFSSVVVRSSGTTASSWLLAARPIAAASSLFGTPPTTASSARFMSKKSTRQIDSTNEQHETWVEFQNQISVDRFDTGQITKIVDNAGKRRGGKLLRKMKEKEAKMREKMSGGDTAKELSQLGGGEYPALRYSDEETERLLAMAYAGIPERTGKRGTRNLRRQRLKVHYVRKINRKIKKHRIAAHFRRMEKRKARKDAVLEVKETSAETREREGEYQEYVLRRWAEKCGEGHGLTLEGSELEKKQASIEA